MSFERRFGGFRGQNEVVAHLSQKPSFLRNLLLCVISFNFRAQTSTVLSYARHNTIMI
jgi:hypothetical protein